MVNMLIGCIGVVGIMVIFYIVGRLIHLIFFGISSRETQWEEVEETLIHGGIGSLVIAVCLSILYTLGYFINTIIL
jgi:hypothetical protein